jgi:hypothetical protein
MAYSYRGKTGSNPSAPPRPLCPSSRANLATQAIRRLPEEPIDFYNQWFAEHKKSDTQIDIPRMKIT